MLSNFETATLFDCWSVSWNWNIADAITFSLNQPDFVVSYFMEVITNIDAPSIFFSPKKSARCLSLELLRQFYQWSLDKVGFEKSIQVEGNSL